MTPKLNPDAVHSLSQGQSLFGRLRSAGKGGANLLWPLSPEPPPALDHKQIHAWCARLPMFAKELSECYAMLSDSEHARAASFHSREHLDTFVIRRGLLRSLLAHYLAVSPEVIEFREGPTGKPEVITPSGRGSIHFSSSHSGQLAVYALRSYGPVGVDVEGVRPLRELPDLTSRCFTERELHSLHAVPEKEKLTAFFNGWTRKEAVLKATGQGIGEAMTEVEVNLAPDEQARVLRFRGEESTASGWSLHALAPAHGYVAALAYEGAARELSCWSYPH